MPARFYKNGLVGVHADAIIGAMPRRVHIVIAVPVGLVPPVRVWGIPDECQQLVMCMHS